MARKQLNVTIDPSLDARLRHTALVSCRSVALIVDLALRDFLDTYRDSDEFGADLEKFDDLMANTPPIPDAWKPPAHGWYTEPDILPVRRIRQ